MFIYIHIYIFFFLNGLRTFALHAWYTDQMGLQHRKTCSCRGVGLGGKSAHEQGCTQSTTHWVPSQHMSSVMMIFQNQAGKEEWPVTETKLDALEKAWMPPEMAEGAS